ncbi:zinc finger MYM-type protein 1-like, partial [Olea europaea var. sylvestris]|uniref:zinc finger MYM-type protein 1-like n=1 Tax=Olea europaea var. sylvestris TaxID=158386 RepID=UPI000C1D272F
MEKYFKSKSTFSCDGQNVNERNIRNEKDEMNAGDESNETDGANLGDVPIETNVEDVGDERLEFDVAQLPSDPGLRVPIQNYDVNVRDVIRRAYVQRGPCQPRNHEFPPTRMGNKDRRFCVSWYNEHPSWLEYSIEKDAVFCLYCYLFSSSDSSFVNGGFSNWKRKEIIRKHVGASSSAHNQARTQYESFKNQEQNIQSYLFKQSHQTRTEYRIRLNASTDCVRFLLRQGLAFRGHDESEDSNNQRNFLELLHWLCDHNDEIKVVALTNAPENLKLTSPRVQKDIVSAISSEILNVIIKDIGDSLFSIIIDESRDISVKEQMSVVIRYVKSGRVLEHFIGVIHVSSTTAISLQIGIDQLFSTHSLCISNLRGQGYDGASNMRGEYNGLKTLILNENPSAYYIHCFAHQLQLALIAVAQKHPKIEIFFTSVHRLVNVVGGSAKR